MFRKPTRNRAKGKAEADASGAAPAATESTTGGAATKTTGAKTKTDAKTTRTISRRAMRFATAGATLGLIGALVLVGSGLSDDDGDDFDNVSDRPALPQGSPVPGYAGAEDTALDLASHLEAVESAPGQTCPADELAVSWTEPDDEYETGAHYAPVGPRPDGNESANGIVYCQGFDFNYTGFSIDWDGSSWTADLAPNLGEDDVDSGGAAAPTDPTDPTDPADPTDPTDPTDPDDPDLPSPSGPDDLVDQLATTLTEVNDITDLRLTEDWQGLFDELEIEDLAEYEPQTVCSPSPKAGTFGFSEMVLEAFDSTGTSGISRACDQGDRSEHKEGRAWDWSALVDDEEDARAASQIIGWLLATDEHGNEYAMARRLGLMYMIYNQSIWRAYAPEDGWVGYTGPNPHTDHVHFSFNRPGGSGETSFWDVAELPDVADVGFGPYAYLPDAGTTPSSVTTPGTDTRPTIPALGNGGGIGNGGGNGNGNGNGNGGGTGGDPDDPDAPDDPDDPGTPDPPGTPGFPLPTIPPPTIPVPTVPTIPGLPLCPPGTPLFPLPLHCILP